MPGLTFSNREKLAEVRRELAMRGRVYPKRIAQRLMTLEDAECFEEAPELIRARLVDQDDAFHRAMAKAPEGKSHPERVDKTPGTHDPHTVCRPATAVIRSSSGW